MKTLFAKFRIFSQIHHQAERKKVSIISDYIFCSAFWRICEKIRNIANMIFIIALVFTFIIEHSIYVS